MKFKDDNKTGRQSEKSSRVVPIGIMFVVLCGLSFYLGGIFCSEKNRISGEQVSKPVESKEVEPTVSGAVQVKSVSFPECGAELQDYTPCTDPKVYGFTGFLIACLFLSTSIDHKKNNSELTLKLKEYLSSVFAGV